MSRYGYLEVFQSPLEFEITRVDCIFNAGEYLYSQFVVVFVYIQFIFFSESFWI